MTASLQGSITVNTSTIDKAIERVNKLNTQLKQITAATNAFEKAYAKGATTTQKQIDGEKAKTEALRAEVAAIKARDAAVTKSDKIQAQNTAKISQATNATIALNQRITKSKASFKDQAASVTVLNSALAVYQQEVVEAAGDTAKLIAAKTKFSNVVASTRVNLNTYNSALETSTRSEVAKINALTQLEKRYILSKQAIAGTTLSAAAQKVQIDKLTANYKNAKNSLTQYGTQNIKTAQDMSKFNLAIVKQSNDLRNSLKGVGRGAGQAGIQIQQFVGQVQGGVDPMIAFSQQSADLGFVLGFPLAGAIAGIAFSLGSALVPALFNGKSAAEELDAVLEKLGETTSVTDEGIVEMASKLGKLTGKSLTLGLAQASVDMSNINVGIKKSVEVIEDALDPVSNARLKQYLQFETNGAEMFKGLNASGMQALSETIRITGNDLEEIGEKLGYSGKDAINFGKAISTTFGLVKSAPTTENIEKFVETLSKVNKNSTTLTDDSKELVQALLDQSLAVGDLGARYKFLTEFVKDPTAALEEFKNKSNSTTNALQKLIEKLQTEKKSLEDNSQSLQQYTIDTMKGSDADKELAKSLSESVDNLKAKIKEEELAKKAQESLTNSIQKMRDDLTIANELNSEGAEAAFKLSYALKFSESAYASLTPEVQAQVQELWNLTGAKEAAAKATKEEAKALRELLAMGNVRPDTTSFTAIDATAQSQTNTANTTFGDTNGGTEAQAALKAANDKIAADRITAINNLNMKVVEATRLGTISENEALLNKYEQQKAIITQAYADEEALQKQHIATLDKNYNQQNFLLNMSQTAEVATGVLQGAMDGLSAYNKESGKDYQRIAIAQAGIAQVLAQTKIWSEYASQPWLAAGLSAASLAQFGGMIANIKSQSFATGGYVSGAGTATSDSIPANLSNGEYVMKASAVSRLGTGYMDKINSGQVPMYSSGGMIGTSSSTASQSSSGGNMTIQIINEGSSDLEVSNTEQGLDSNGQAVMKVFIRQIVQEEISQGRLDSSMSKNYGVKRQPIGR